MIKIVKPEDLQNISDTEVFPYIQNLLDSLLKEYAVYCPGSSIERIGAIFLLERAEDLELYAEMGLCSPIQQNSFEWIEDIGGYCNGCIVLDTDRAINIIGKSTIFENIRKETST
ncbi:MAG: hypothetical protein J1E00_02410 [Oscillospiraceae bacterium]|nr:hypothetical protein [Oscillospiraceae bacterium]